MQTVFDWLSMILFLGLVVLFLQRSTQETLTDRVWHYVPPAIGCAGSNWLGNNGYSGMAIAGLGAVFAYIVFILKPFPTNG